MCHIILQDPVKCVKQLAEFLKVSASDELCSAIADACDFQKLKKIDESGQKTCLDSEQKMFVAGKSKLYRKGKKIFMNFISAIGLVMLLL